jgi:hypothetical protein
MNMHIYAFGSICRGEIDMGSDVDLLACTDRSAPNIDTEKYSLYRYDRLKALWKEGNPFAWHLHLESKLLFSPDGSDFLKDLGSPAKYQAGPEDCKKFKMLFENAYKELMLSSNSATFHLSCIFLAVRNFATCHSLSIGKPIFSRKSPLLVEPSLVIEPQVFEVLTRARLLSTRGYGESITPEEVSAAIQAVNVVPHWMETLRRSILQ